MTKTFRDLGVDAALCDALADTGITHPFPIQELTLPLGLEGHDLIGQARTGTGKTLAFGLPLLQRVDASSKHTQALVIVPTRELCLQVHSDLQIGAVKGLTSISVYGGVGYDEQIDALTAGAHVVVGTPGRLLDLLNRGVLDLSRVSQLVLDEADEMLDMGFLPDVERLVEACKGEDRHTMLFSATMPTAIVKLARRYMDHPTFTRADHEQKNTAPLVTQYFFEVHRMDKPRLLARLLQTRDRGGVYVFVRTKHMADRLVNDLEDLHIPSIAIHGDLRQTTREKNLDRFRAGQATVLVCTEVAARGLDVTGVTHVVNYDCPDDEKMYLHRIGRTARAGEAGVAITFAEFNEIDRLNVIRKAVGAVDSEVQRIFSTSKQLSEMFDLPEERPWDHLTTRSGSDEARARRESRSDGKPKSGRSQEGRGGEHDARRSPRGEHPGRGERRDRGDDGRDRDERSRRATSTSPRDRGRTAEPDPSASTAAPASDAAASTSDDASGGAGERAAADRPTTRTRTRTRARSKTSTRHGSDGPSSASRSTPSSRSSSAGDIPATSERRAATDAPPEPDSGSGRPSSSGRQRARGGRSNVQRSRAAEAKQDGADTEEARTSSDSGGERGSGRRSGGGRPAGGRSRGGRSEGGRSKGGRSGSGRSESGRREGGRPDGGEGNTGGGSPGSGRSRGGSRDGGRGRHGGRASGTDATVPVARRGEDARGDGQPQISRRVKIEHLP